LVLVSVDGYATRSARSAEGHLDRRLRVADVMPGMENPLRRERLAGIVTAALVCLAVPSVLLTAIDPLTGVAHREGGSWFLGPFAAGALVPLLVRSPYHALGIAPLAAMSWLAALLTSPATGIGSSSGRPDALLLGVVLGAVVRGRRGPTPVRGLAWISAAALVGVAVAWGCEAGGLPTELRTALLGAVALGLVVWTWGTLFRPLFELALEPVVWVMYRISPRGPGLAALPRTGPCVVLANHACWFDPLFLAKVFPRPLTPMMTARFFDLPVIRRLMVAFGVIRVPETAIKHATPEIDQAVAALDRGECLLVFPEGYLRRTADRPLRRFGQGIWHILRARPGTPVVACWIEGGWGSYTSHFGGPPAKDKRPDFRRPIGIGVSTATTVPPDVLSDHLHTRVYLMNLTEAARTCLGLSELPPFEWHGEEKNYPSPAVTPVT
jgi:1-acyl-sn-glycerol-3-phosphate acyltransferase